MNLEAIGKITKLHGVFGELILTSEQILPQNIEKTEWIFLQLEGLPVPFFVFEARLKTDTTAILKIKGIDNANIAADYIGCEVAIAEHKKRRSARKKDIPSNNVSGYKVIDSKHGEVGIADTVVNYHGNFLLSVFKDKNEILIPVTEDIVLEIDDSRKIIHVQTPDGLLDLYK